jgi:hypothetical protein
MSNPFSLLALFLLLAPDPVPAEVPADLGPERILSFDSKVIVNADGSLGVTETIRVVARGSVIRHGIYRDFPTHYGLPWFGEAVVPFAVAGALRDGQPEAFRVERYENGKRVYLGSPGVMVPQGIHTYAIDYRTDRQLGFFRDHDELSWNATGNGWSLPIEQASAEVRLPGGVPREKVTVAGYTGPQGARGRNYAASVDPAGRARFQTTAPLGPKEGLTIVVGWPKGFVAQPSLGNRLRWLALENGMSVVALLGFLLVLAYFLIAWVKVGRDPAAGPIGPRMMPPQGLSAAAVRFIDRMGYDRTCFTALVVNLAVKGYLTIDQRKDGFTLTKNSGTPSEPLSDDERAVFDGLLSHQQKLDCNNAHCATFQSAEGALKKALKGAFEDRYYHTNSSYFMRGVLLSLAVIVASSLVAFFNGKPEVVFVTVWLSFWSVGVAVLLAVVVQAWKGASSGGFSAGRLIGAIVLTVFALPFFGGELMGLGLLGYRASIFWALVFVALLVLNVLFQRLLKAPTEEGRSVMDAIEGFRLYLAGGHGDDFGQPPQGFDKYFPYALALGVENAWSKRFSAALGAAGTAPAGGQMYYQPYWYGGNWSHGSNWSSFGSSFSSAISSASTATGSSSGGGGGGSSGGGGGGGGGGGW